MFRFQSPTRPLTTLLNGHVNSLNYFCGLLIRHVEVVFRFPEMTERCRKFELQCQLKRAVNTLIGQKNLLQNNQKIRTQNEKC